ncbi:MAG: metallophosphoesterase, partial [Actinomycetes bacterium]
SRAGVLASSIKKADVDAFAVLGDFQYEYGDCGSLVEEFDRTGMGDLLPKIIGTAGPTHDWTSFSDQDNYRRHMAGTCPGQTTGKSLSTARWGSDVGPETSHWVDLGRWRVFSVSSGLWRYNTDAAGEVTTWLDTELSKGKAAGDHMAVIWHEPYWTSNSEGHDRTTEVQPWVEMLDKHDVKIVLSGHQHGYERFHPQNADGSRDDASGTQQFIVGTGGIGSYLWEETLENSAAIQSDTWGWLKLTLKPDGHYDWRFVRTGGEAFADTGSR